MKIIKYFYTLIELLKNNICYRFQEIGLLTFSSGEKLHLTYTLFLNMIGVLFEIA